jgi:SAM-dependent methyltransferase
MTDSTTATVRGQYEHLPYPHRDPESERRELRRTWLDDLPMIAHYGYGGAHPFGKGFRVLVAGGGTGDGTIFLAEQLRQTDAEVVHLDLSSASIAIAQKRAEIRGLGNIRWVRESLLDLPRLDVGAFDYINCVGVLHHLDDPDAGLKALLGVLKDDGVLGLMVYALYGRTGVYQMQSLMRLVNEGASDAGERLARTKEILAALPRGNWFKRGEELYSDHQRGDAGTYDLLLHSRDRAYTVGQLYDWIEGANGLHMTLTDLQRGRAPYLPHLLMGPKPPAVLHQIRQLPMRKQQEIAELYCGTVQTHSFFASRQPGRVARYGDAELVPFFYHEPVTGPDIARVFKSNQGRPFVLNHAHTGVNVTIAHGRWRRSVLEHIDGHRTWGEVFARVRAEPAIQAAAPTHEALFEDFREIYELLNAIERLLLRRPSVA